jgi:hypothetical protein
MTSTNRRSSWSVIMALSTVLAWAQPVLAGEEVNLSRYKITLTDEAPLPATWSELDQTIVSDLCRDGDGCLVTLTLETPTFLDFNQNRLFISATSQRWDGAPLASCGAVNFCTDANGVGQPLMATGDGPTYNCIFTDQEGAGGDTVEGWGLFAFQATCTVVIMD